MDEKNFNNEHLDFLEHIQNKKPSQASIRRIESLVFNQLKKQDRFSVWQYVAIAASFTLLMMANIYFFQQSNVPSPSPENEYYLTNYIPIQFLNYE